jgi:leader peptidase (prepilin peptidase)/N-methyltransferase
VIAGLVLALLVALGGASVGSFAGVVAGRGWRPAMAGRSHCDGCGRTLKWFELVPLVSYLLLRGRCRTCRAPIGRAALAWEAAGAGLALIALIAGVGLFAA